MAKEMLIAFTDLAVSARATIPGQFVPATANVFGRIVGDSAAFYDVCRRLPREGAKRLAITAI